MVKVKLDKTSDVTNEQRKKVATLLKKGLRYFGKAATGLKNQMIDPKYAEMPINRKLIQAGIEGEESTSKLLRKWIADKPNAILIDSISLPLEDREEETDEEEGAIISLADTDHALLIGNNLIIIDSKNWKTKTSYKVSEEGEILRGNSSFPGNKPKMKQMQYVWQNFLKDLDEIEIDMYLCIPSPDPFILRDRNWWRAGYKFTNEESLIYFLDKFYEEDEYIDKEHIRIDVLTKILTGLQRPYNPVKEKFPELYKAMNRKG